MTTCMFLASMANYLGTTDTNYIMKSESYQIIGGSCLGICGNYPLHAGLLLLAKVPEELCTVMSIRNVAIITQRNILSTTIGMCLLMLRLDLPTPRHAMTERSKYTHGWNHLLWEKWNHHSGIHQALWKDGPQAQGYALSLTIPQSQKGQSGHREHSRNSRRPHWSWSGQICCGANKAYFTPYYQQYKYENGCYDAFTWIFCWRL